jgi:hypothetical protein
MNRTIFTLAALAFVLPVMAETAKIQTSKSGQEFGRSGSRTPIYSEIKPSKELPKPRSSGIIYEISEKGFVVINPLAPKEINVQASTWAATPTTSDLSLKKEDEGKRTGGGFKLISLEW